MEVSFTVKDIADPAPPSLFPHTTFCRCLEVLRKHEISFFPWKRNVDFSMSENEMIGKFSKKTVSLKLLYHWTKPFNDLNNFWFGFPNAF
jgi:hypothetical protein